MKSKNIVWSLCTILVITALLMTGCGSAATPAPEEAVASAEPATEAGPAAEPVTLVYWSMWNEDEPQAQVIQQAIDAFETANPNVQIEVTWQGRPVRDLFIAAIEAGQVIDLVDNDTGRIALTWGDQYILSLDSYLDQPALGVEGKTVRETIYPALLNQYVTAEGHTASVPYNPFVVMWFYNKQHFTDAGITAVPQTFEEWMQVNEALRAAGHENIFTFDPDYYTDIMAGDSAQRYVGCDGFTAALQDPTGESWRQPGFVQWASDMEALAAYADPNTAANTYPAGQQQVALGEDSMIYMGTWLFDEVRDTAGPDFQWGAFSWPGTPNGAGSINDFDMGSQGMAITQASQHPDEAFDFIRYVVSLNIQSLMVDGGYPSAHVDVPWTGDLADAYTTLQNAETAFGWACNGWDTGDIFANNLLPAFTDLITGTITADAFIERMVTETKEFYNQ